MCEICSYDITTLVELTFYDDKKTPEIVVDVRRGDNDRLVVTLSSLSLSFLLNRDLLSATPHSTLRINYFRRATVFQRFSFSLPLLLSISSFSSLPFPRNYLVQRWYLIFIFKIKTPR